MLKNLIIVQAILLVFQIILYFGCEIFQKNMHDVHRKIDDKIPFIPISSISYSFWFPLIAVFPIVLFYADSKLYVTYMTTMVSEIVLSVICYLVYPTTFKRPVPPETWDGKIMKLIYKGSFKGINCAPSLHCSSCYLVLFMSIVCSTMTMPLRILFSIIAILIVISTMTTKQHTVIDVTTAILMFIICLIIGMIFPMNFLLTFLK